MKNNDINGKHSRIESSTSIKGDIVSEGDFRIDGTLEGSIKTNGKIVIGKEGFVNGGVSCNNADVEGKIKGNLFVSETLNLRSTCHIDGEVVIGKLMVESGANFNASCSMNKECKKADIQLVSKLEESHEQTA
jgi:cytoskeletal protein CcmA (bactofilin family)